jgi:hypothetical protein
VRLSADYVSIDWFVFLEDLTRLKSCPMENTRVRKTIDRVLRRLKSVEIKNKQRAVAFIENIPKKSLVVRVMIEYRRVRCSAKKQTRE